MFRFLPVVSDTENGMSAARAGQNCVTWHIPECVATLHNTPVNPLCVQVTRYTWHQNTRGGIAECGETLWNVSCDTVLARPGCGHPVLGVVQQQVENETWKLKESRDIINLTIIIRSGPAVTWLRHTVMSPGTVRSVSRHSATHPYVLVSGISGHSFGPPWLWTSRSWCWTTTGRKRNMEVESASNVNCDPSSKSPLKLYFWSKKALKVNIIKELAK